MPFINGRYYVNPIIGQALEAAREAEAALASLENRAGQNSDAPDGQSQDELNGARGPQHGAAEGPIHRVEIEAAEMVPAHSGRAAHGYVARVHRHSAANSDADAANSLARSGGKATSNPETHVFADHRDLLNFLRDELAKSAQSGS
jgi:hypothetical protein